MSKEQEILFKDIKDKLSSNVGGFIGPVKSYAAKSPIPFKRYLENPTGKMDKGLRFVKDKYGNVTAGLYFTYLKDTLEKYGVETLKDFFRELEKLILQTEYTGSSGELLDRIGKMRSSKGAKDTHAVSAWRHGEEINIEDIYVVSLSFELSKEEYETLERMCHNYCEEYRTDGKRFGIWAYSSSDGTNGTEKAAVERYIKNLKSLKEVNSLADFLETRAFQITREDHIALRAA